MKKQGRRIFGTKYLLHDFVRVTAALPGIVWLRPKIIFESPEARHIKGGALVISNHVGFLDPVYLMFGIWYRRHRFIATKEFFTTPFKRFLFGKMFMCIEIDRENVSMKTFRDITDSLKQGDIVTMFPEGHIGTENGTGAFKSGMVLMALRGGAPIVPVYIKKPAHFYNRLVMAVGAPVAVKPAGAIPTLAEIDSASVMLREKEGALEKLIK